MKYHLFFDTETSGKYDFRSSHTAQHQPDLVQLAALLTDEEFNVMGEINVIVEPMSWVISEEVAKIHKITHDMAKSVGVPRKVALAMFNHLVKHADNLIAHNLNFDFNVMLGQFHKEGAHHRMASCRKICTMLVATPILKLPKGWVSNRIDDQYKWPKLEEAYAYYFDGARFDGAHNAMVDVLALSKVFQAMIKKGHVTP